MNFYVWHLPVLYQAALRHDPVHALQHACSLGFGMAMWMALLGPLPKPAWFTNGARLVYIVAVRLAGTVLANAMIFSGSVFYPIYRAGDAHWHISPMADQISAAGVMMVEESLLTIGLFCWLFLKVARENEERQALLDYAASQGVELDEARAARAVAAGRGAELWERVRARAAVPQGAGAPQRACRRLLDGQRPLHAGGLVAVDRAVERVRAGLEVLADRRGAAVLDHLAHLR